MSDFTFLLHPSMEPSHAGLEQSHAGLEHEPLEWPSLKDSFCDAASHSKVEDEDDGWDLVSPITPPGEREVILMGSSLRGLRGSASSPNLIRLCALAAVDEEDDSFSMVSGAPSVLSAVSSLQSGISFRDAVLSPTTSVNSTEEENMIREPPNCLQRPRNRPKLVVAPIKRCAHSTGDLQSLVIHEDEILGDTDAIEYYSQKSHGYVSRKNGMKQRPDELKRLQMVMYKKGLQRAQQQQK